MLGRRHITGYVAAVLMLLAPALSQSNRPLQNQDQSAPRSQPRNSPGGNSQPRNPQGRNSPPNRGGAPGPRPPNQPGHAGAWLRHYKDVPLAEQRRALESDPQYRRLPPQRQLQLQNRLQHF